MMGPSGASARQRVQRQLHITDQDQLFSDKAQAEAYLRAEYANVYSAALDRDMTARLLELAESAASPNRVIPIQLAAALAYIHSGTALNVAPHYVDPSRSPLRTDPGLWQYQMGGSPSALEAPQSPQYLFPESSFPSLQINIPANLQSAKQSLGTELPFIPPSKLGNNSFKYQVDVEARYTMLLRKSGPGGSTYFGPASAASFGSERAESDLYTSSFSRPTRKGVKAIPYQDEMRQELQHIKDDIGPKRPYFRERSSLYAHERDRSANDKSGAYFTDRARSSPQAIGNLYAHSEVQAAAHAHNEAGRDLARTAMNKVMEAARRQQAAGGGGPIEVVVAAITWSGHSAPNSVCGNACKGALIHIGEVLEDHFTNLRHRAKAGLAKENILLRGSEMLTVSGHVGSDVEYPGGGYGAGAMPRAPGGGATRTKGRFVTEYSPYG